MSVDFSSKVGQRVNAIINRHAEYMNGFDRGQINFGVEAVINMVRDALGENLDDEDAKNGWVFYGPDGEWHWSIDRQEHESIEDQRPATAVEAYFATRAGK